MIRFLLINKGNSKPHVELNDDFYYNIVDNIFELTYEEVIKYAKDNVFYNNTYEKLMLLVENENPTEEFYRSLI
ncbi:MAG: hypothetical protein E6Z74_08870 [Clostridium perfringens]|nr:hypothetical protein [Clostridium perfringens]MDU5776023.1 hypothetical protein [Clostridium perfringens]